jgi:imidazolonepropionase-like amidohydrolase
MPIQPWKVIANAILCVGGFACAPRLVAQQAAPPTAFTHVTVLTMADSQPLVNQTVVISGNHIVGLGPTATMALPAGSRVIKARGKFLLPGLWDMHAHLPDDSTTRAVMLPLYLANGVTGLRDMWGDCESTCAGTDSAGIAPPASVVRAWKNDIAAGALLGPRLVVAGNGLRGSAPSFPGTRAIRDSADAVEAVRYAKAQGADFLKIIGDIPPEAYFVLLRTAQAHGLPVAGHVPAGVSPRAVSDSGQRSVEHLQGATLECTSQPDSVLALRAARARDTSATRRAMLSRAIYHLAVSSFDEAACQPYFARLVQNDTWQAPTLSVLHHMAWAKDYDARRDTHLRYATTRLRSEWEPRNDFRLQNMSAEDFAGLKQLYAASLRIVGAMGRAGVPLLAGSDPLNPHHYPGFGLHEEMQALVDAGLSPRAAIVAATTGPARFFEATDSLGSIAPGQLADLVLLDADPLTDVRNASRIRAVVVNGQLLTRKDLDRLLRGAEAYAKAH